MKHLKLFFTICILFSFSIISGQKDTKENNSSELFIETEIRPRTEYNHGYKMPVSKYIIQDEYKYPGSLITNQRSRLNIGYKSQKLKLGLVLQDVRTWGNQAQLVANEALSTSVHQAWAEVFFTKEISLKAGRMELAYDDHRILGSVGWAPQARSHDLALFKYTGAANIHLGLAYHGGPYNGPDAYKFMQYLWVNGKSDKIGYSVLVLNNGIRERGYWYGTLVDEKNAYSQTIGTRLIYKLGYIDFALNAYYQTGIKSADWMDLNSLPDNETLTDYNTVNGTNYLDGPKKGQKISAYNFALDMTYEVSDYIKTGLSYEFLSGNDFTDLNRSDENAFTPLYGTNHKFNGWMDYFYVGNHGSNIGLQDINAKIIINKDNFFLKLIPHYFLPASKSEYIDNNGETKAITSLGTEIDLWAGYYIIPKVASIEIGYSHMFATESMYALKSGTSPLVSGDPSNYGINNWVWIMLNVKPQWTFKK